MRLYKVKYKSTVDNSNVVKETKYKFFRTLHFATKFFKKLTKDNTILLCYMDKFNEETGKFDTENKYIRGGNDNA